MRIVFVGLAALALSLGASMPVVAQDCGWSYVDHRVSYDASGPWNPNAYRSTAWAFTAAQVGGALWEGADTRLGKTMWQGIDSEIIASAGAEGGKYAFGRVRPSTENNPCLWFKGQSNRSFPSGEAAMAAGLVTPYVLEYGRDYPATWLLLALPGWVGAGRIKNQAHWQSDVLAGWAVGGLSGWYAHEREQPVLVQLLPHGVTVGMHATF